MLGLLMASCQRSPQPPTAPSLLQEPRFLPILPPARTTAQPAEPRRIDHLEPEAGGLAHVRRHPPQVEEPVEDDAGHRQEEDQDRLAAEAAQAFIQSKNSQLLSDCFQYNASSCLNCEF